MHTSQKDTTPPLDHLPAYRVRVSAKAKRAQLQVSMNGQVEVVIPRRFNPAHVPAFVAEHHRWLERTLARVKSQRGDFPELYDPMPSRIHLRAIDERWEVQRQIGDCRRAGLTELPGAAVLKLRAPTQAACRAVLHQWLSGRAKSHLAPWVRALSAELGLPCNRVTVRAQKTRWGSCSTRRNININRNLLFLAPAVVRYLFVHELCHTVHLNHSRRYWALVERFEPDYRHLDAELTLAGRYVPLWACPD
ncbi:MAG TPA: SprT family zinc-dependent metalloprotease [Gammaproteobacteria bacterium]|nr:SprT family zinc-dependent metalloprotease [Gammaproteobacteria bacterium]